MRNIDPTKTGIAAVTILLIGVADPKKAMPKANSAYVVPWPRRSRGSAFASWFT
jgi:hypothetical protein